MSYDADLKLFIDGNWKSGDGRDAHTVINPVDGGGIADVPLANAADKAVSDFLRRKGR